MIEQLRAQFPAINHWIDAYIVQSQAHAQTVIGLGFDELKKAFRLETLGKAKLVRTILPERPPLTAMGLPQFGEFERMSIDGITYKDSIFVRLDKVTPDLVFHEMVHVVQWDVLGPENFLLTYAQGLAIWGYRGSPLEVMAYGLQRRFANHDLPIDTEAQIRVLTPQIAAAPDTMPAKLDF